MGSTSFERDAPALSLVREHLAGSRPSPLLQGLHTLGMGSDP